MKSMNFTVAKLLLFVDRTKLSVFFCFLLIASLELVIVTVEAVEFLIV